MSRTFIPMCRFAFAILDILPLNIYRKNYNCLFNAYNNWFIVSVEFFQSIE